MASPVKTYFLTPNWEFPPGGIIALGSLITDPKKPERSLNKGKLISIAPDALYHGSKKNWELTRAQLGETRVGVWASFLQLVGLGGDLGYTSMRSSNEVYKCASLETDYFQPDDAYIFEALQNPVVKSYIGNSWYKEPVYMITGLKIARGFTVTSKRTKIRGVDGKLGADGTGAGVPVTAGPELNSSIMTSEEVSFGGSSACVFAYQLIKIRPRKNDKFSDGDYNRGALLNNDESGEIHRLEELHVEWEVLPVKEDKSDLVGRTIHDEDGSEVCVVIKA